MKRVGRMTSLLGLTAAVAVTVVAVGAGTASAASHTILSDKQIKKVLLPLSQIQKVSGAAGPVTAADVTCHEAPYYAGNVHYCYYEQMRSDAAYGAGTYSPSHVDILSFDNAKLPATYLKEMKAGGGPTATTLAATPTMVVKFDPKASIGTAPDASGQPVIVTGPTVSVYQSKGSNVVYTVCANPRGGSSAQLTTCAKALAKAQLAKL